MTRHDKEKYEDIHRKAVVLLEKKGFENIKADLEGFAQPKPYVRKETGVATIPDIVAERNGQKYLFDLTLKTNQKSLLKTKIMFLKQLATIKNYHLRILTTRGHVKFSQEVTANTGLSPSAFMRV